MATLRRLIERAVGKRSRGITSIRSTVRDAPPIHDAPDVPVKGKFSKRRIAPRLDGEDSVTGMVSAEDPQPALSVVMVMCVARLE